MILKQVGVFDATHLSDEDATELLKCAAEPEWWEMDVLADIFGMPNGAELDAFLAANVEVDRVAHAG